MSGLAGACVECGHGGGCRGEFDALQAVPDIRDKERGAVGTDGARVPARGDEAGREGGLGQVGATDGIHTGVGGVEGLAVRGEGESVGQRAPRQSWVRLRGDCRDNLAGGRLDHADAVAAHVGDVEFGAVGVEEDLAGVQAYVDLRDFARLTCKVHNTERTVEGDGANVDGDEAARGRFAGVIGARRSAPEVGDVGGLTVRRQGYAVRCDA